MLQGERHAPGALAAVDPVMGRHHLAQILVGWSVPVDDLIGALVCLLDLVP